MSKKLTELIQDMIENSKKAIELARDADMKLNVQYHSGRKSAFIDVLDIIGNKDIVIERIDIP